MKTKFFARFLNRCAHFDADLELVDIFAIAVAKGVLVPASGGALFEHLDSKKHTRLGNRTGSDQGRTIAIGHLKATVSASFLKDLYEDVTKYMTDLIAGAARNGLSPQRLVGEHKVTFEANDLLQCKSMQDISELVAKSLFRRLEEERSTIQMLTSVDKKLGLGVPDKVRDAALPYLELRHLLVHADGVADQDFCKRFPIYRVQPGNAVILTYPLISKARSAIVQLVTEYDKCAVKKGVIALAEQQP